MSASAITAQEDITNIFMAGKDDLSKVANGYLAPAGNVFATGLGSNWYNTADVHSAFGFDITIGGGAVIIPKEDRTFRVDEFTALTPSSTASAPTFGGSGNGVGLDLKADGKPVTSFKTPHGVSSIIPTASVQVTVGLPFINDVTVRFMPKISVGGFEASMWGLGIKHDIKKYIPVVSLLPFDASVMVNYTKMNLNYEFPPSTITPDMLIGAGSPFVLAAPASAIDYTKQGMNIDASAMSANLLISKKLLFLTPYLGLGITRTNFDLTMTGNYPLLAGPSGTVNSSGKPIMNIDNLPSPKLVSTSLYVPSATVGLRVKILFLLTAHVQYTMQKYPVISTGFGFSFR